MTAWLLVAGGSALGGVARYACGLWALALFGGGFPWGTLIVNILGSFVIGLVAGLTTSADVRLFVMVGLCGGYTTFSAFSLETLALMQDGAWGKAGLYIALSLIACLAAVWLGYLGVAKTA
ncbi:MAG: fluoride efflux transporter CrcB [Alphaproteobacteria bacterium]|nr:fluoride efflux transporter CrcB [Alphaproteobacteria bacterium]